jgi:intracellular septation protein
MRENKLTKNIYLLSFLPALIYWYLEETQTIEIAVIGGVSLALIEVIAEKLLTNHVHSLSKLNLIILLVLGPFSLIAKEGIWFKLQPFFTGVFLFSYMFYNTHKGESIMHKMSEEMNMKNKMPKEILLILEKHMAFFLLIFGFFMAYLAKYESTSVWAFFKTVGFYIAFAFFLVFEFIFMRKKIVKQFILSQDVSPQDNNR